MTTNIMTDLPIETLLPDIVRHLRAKQRLVLGAPPGAGKTTRVPLALGGLLPDVPGLAGRILVLEPRRLAARLAAERMAATLGEGVGERIGLSTRIEQKRSRATRVEVMTDGVFLRRLIESPELHGVGAVLFDEVHERRLNNDLGLALVQEAQSVLRPDLCIMAMSATLDTKKLSRHLQCEVLESSGRQHPVETVYVGKSRNGLEQHMANIIHRAFRDSTGSILAFLPGAREIRRTAEHLDRLKLKALVTPLYGALGPEAQDAAIRAVTPPDRKIVLATDIAESSLTIEGVSVVIDSGLTRVPEWTGLEASPKLVTQRASRASVDQRRGRAGRLGPGTCYRLWDEAETRGLTPQPAPEILTADLTGLVLSLAQWGETNPERLSWVDPPPRGRLAAARQTLYNLNAIGTEGHLTDRGRAMAKLPVAPRLAALIASATSSEHRALAAHLAVLISEPGLGGASDDLSDRLSRFLKDPSPRARALRSQAESWSDHIPPAGQPANVLARAWPDRIARRRAPGSEVWLLASGRAATVPRESALARHDWILVADLAGSARQARVTAGLALDEATALACSPPQEHEEATFSAASRQFRARRVRAIGAITLFETPLPRPSGTAAKAAFLDHLRSEGFGPTGLEEALRTHCARLTALRSLDPDRWPDTTLTMLQASVDKWLGPALSEKSFTLPSGQQVMAALMQSCDWKKTKALNDQVPLTLLLPSGRRATLNWLDDRAPLVEGRVQEFYGSAPHPCLADGRLLVTVQLMSPGGKPVATTRDLPAFWRGGYQDMAKDMRGRYPKHDWPEAPSRASPHPGLTKARLNR
jgi:ATP-dependent helicase HrpB